MAYKLEDHWLEQDRSMVELRQRPVNSNVAELLKKRIKNYLDSVDTIEDADFSEAIVREIPSHIDLYI